MKKSKSPRNRLRKSKSPRNRLRKSKSPRNRLRKSKSSKQIKMNFGIKEKWLIYSKKGCPYCEDAKNILLKRKTEKDNVEVEIIDKDTLSSPLVVYKDGKKYETWPRIFLNDEFIGGFGDLKNKFYS